MSKYIVETYYTCTFKIVHKLDELNDKKLSELENRNDGKFEIIDVKLNNRKTKAINNENSNIKLSETSEKNIPDISSIMNEKINNSDQLENKNMIAKKLIKQSNNRSKMPDRRKGYIQKVTIQNQNLFTHWRV